MVSEINNKLDKLNEEHVKEQLEKRGEEQTKSQKKQVSYNETAIKRECKYKNC